MEDMLNQDVNQEGQNQASVLPDDMASSSQQIDDNRSSQDQGDVNNPDMLKNKFMESQRKLDKAMQEIDLLKNMFGQQQQQRQQLQNMQTNVAQPDYQQQQQKDLQLLNMKDEYLQELEETSPDGRIKANELRNERHLALQRHRDRQEKEREERIYRRIKAEEYETKIKAEYPEVLVENSPQFLALKNEYSRLHNGGYQGADIIYEAVLAAERKNPQLFTKKNIQPVNQNYLNQHSVGANSVSPQSQPKNSVQLDDTAMYITQQIGNDPKKVAARIEGYRKQLANRRR